MSYEISNIQIAGAGAGKTIKLANKIADFLKQSNDHKTIYAITYTNSAKMNIIKKLEELIGVIPDNVKVQTVHSFFLEEIIFPFHKYLFGEGFKKAISISLPSKIQFKNYKLRQLNESGIIHNEQVFKKAKMITEKKGNKSRKKKIENIIQHIEDSVVAIFVDEVQDLDEDAFKVFTELSKTKIYIYLVGDPKQAISYPNAFKNFCSQVNNMEIETFEFLENNNVTWRMPEELVTVSNQFCSEDQKQRSVSETKGIMSYIFVEDERFKDYFKEWELENSLIYINKKNKNFQTQKQSNLAYIPKSVEEKLLLTKGYQRYDVDVWLESIIDEIAEDTRKRNFRFAIGRFTKNYNLSLEKNEYAEMREVFNYEGNTSTLYQVTSIHRVKGLEALKCIFVLDNSIIRYLIGEKTERNKELNKLYVALTRSLKELILAVDFENINNLDKGKIEAWFKENAIQKM